jgi:GNAT superfamily N-acetyltransferase
MTFEVRTMEPRHIETVAQLFYNVWHETQAPLQHPAVATLRDLRFFQTRIQQCSPRTLVASLHSRIVGFTCWSPGFLNSLFVATDVRGAGVGAVLCDAAEAAIRADGAQQMSLDCVMDNWRARRFYEKRVWRFTYLHDDEDIRPGGVPATQLWRMEK